MNPTVPVTSAEPEVSSKDNINSTSQPSQPDQVNSTLFHTLVSQPSAEVIIAQVSPNTAAGTNSHETQVIHPSFPMPEQTSLNNNLDNSTLAQLSAPNNVAQIPSTSPTVIQPQFTHIDEAVNLSSVPNEPALNSQNEVALSANSANLTKTGRKIPKLAIGSALLLLLIGGGAVFGLYLPNKPDNVWKTGLDRSGDALNAVYTKATEQKTIAAYDKSQITLDAKASIEGSSFSGKADFKFDASKSNGSVVFSMSDSDGKKQEGGLNFLTDIPAGSVLPDIYFQVNGLKLLNADELFPGLSDLDGKWIFVDHSFLASVYPAESKDLQTKNDLTSDDYLELAKAAISTTTDYVLTSDSNKAVITQKSYVGKEKVDGISAYHYKAGINKDHAKDFCKAIVQNITSTAAYKKVPGVDKTKIEEDKTSNIKDCQESVDKDFKESDEFDVWIDAKYKLIYKIRIYDEKEKDNYVDIGQTYKGGDDITLFSTIHEQKSKSDMRFELSMNMKTTSTKGSVTATSKDEGNPYDVNVTVEAKPYTGEIKVDKPAGAIPFKDVLKKFGLDPDTFNGGQQDPAITVLGLNSQNKTDQERRTDIADLQANLDIFNKLHGYYPTLTQLNSKVWRFVSFKEISPDSFKPPNSDSSSLALIATEKQYGYQPTNCNASYRCNGYGLSAVLSDGVVLKRLSPTVKK